MTISNETKVAALAIVAIGLAIWGYNFIKGKNLLKSSNVFYVEYEEVNLLNVSSPVVINGFKVGYVGDIFLKPEDTRKVVVEIELRDEIKIPTDTKAVLKSTGIMGGQAISLVYDMPCAEGQCAEGGTFLQGETLGTLDALIGKESLKEYSGIVRRELTNLLDTLNKVYLSEDANGPLAESMRNLSATMENLRGATYKLDQMLLSSSADIQGSLANVRGLTDTLAASQGRIANLILNAEKITTDIADANLKQTLDEVKEAVQSLKSTLDNADSAMAGVATATDRLANGEGTLGKLLQDDAIYYRLENISLTADSLMTDFQERPYRYVPFKTRKKVKKYDRKDAQAEANN